jgi:hypothetical protein
MLGLFTGIWLTIFGIGLWQHFVGGTTFFLLVAGSIILVLFYIAWFDADSKK